VTRLFALAGVDYIQWKAVSRTLLRSDFRAPTLQRSDAYSLRSIKSLLAMALVFGLFGIGATVVIVLNPDVLLTGTITLTYFGFALGTTLLTQHGATMLSAADHVILGTRPVTSRTFFAIRLTNVLFHALLTVTLMAYPPVLAYTFAHGLNVARGFAAAAAIYAWAAAVTFGIVAGYTALLRFVGAARLQRAIAYLQLAVGVIVYGGYFVAMETFGRTVLARATMPRAGWLVLLPPAWFASYIEIATGAVSAQTMTRAALSIVLLVTLALLLRGRLAQDYVVRLSEAPAAARDEGRADTRRRWTFLRDEARAVALLTRSHFRHDLRVRMGLFAVVPLLLIYVVRGLRGGNADPFLGPARDSSMDVVALTALMFPAIVLRHLESSDAFRASWIYDVTPVDRGRLVIALKNIATMGFLLPFAGLLTVLFTWRFGHPGHAVVHALLLATVGHAALQLAVLIKPRLPFARPPNKSDGGAILIWMIGVMVGGQLLLVGIQRFVYPSWQRLAIVLAALIALSTLLEVAVRQRARRIQSR
jgi:ABC-2 type transport system permease protein